MGVSEIVRGRACLRASVVGIASTVSVLARYDDNDDDNNNNNNNNNNDDTHSPLVCGRLSPVPLAPARLYQPQ